MTNGQLMDILRQYPEDLDVVVIDWFNDKPKLKLCSKVSKTVIADNGIRQEYLVLGNARPFECLSPVGAGKE